MYSSTHRDKAIPKNTARNSIPPLAKMVFILKYTHHPANRNRLFTTLCGREIYTADMPIESYNFVNLKFRFIFRYRV